MIFFFDLDAVSACGAMRGGGGGERTPILGFGEKFLSIFFG